VFAHPARYEPFGLVALEAALAGCALALGDIPTLRELWDGAALFVTPGDPDSLAQAIDRLIADSRLRRQLAAAALARAAAYDADAMARDYLDLYAHVADRARVAA
jgi:glycogen(starch) synthase